MQDGQILDNSERIGTLMDILGYNDLTIAEKYEKCVRSNVLQVLNMCSTDYSADIVGYLFDAIKDFKQDGKDIRDAAEELCSYIIPPNNGEYIQEETRRRFNKI